MPLSVDLFYAMIIRLLMSDFYIPTDEISAAKHAPKTFAQNTPQFEKNDEIYNFDFTKQTLVGIIQSSVCFGAKTSFGSV